MHLYPIMLNLKGQTVVVVGGGKVASRKVRDLEKTGALINIVSPDFDNEILKLSQKAPANIKLIQRSYREEDLEDASLVLSTTNDSEVNKKIYEDCTERNIFFNSADDPDGCSFYLPSWFKKNDLLVAVSTTGSSPALASKLRKEIESSIPDDIDLKLKALKKARTLLKNESEFSKYDSSCRGKLLKSIVNDDYMLSVCIDNFKKGKLKEFLINLALSDE